MKINNIKTNNWLIEGLSKEQLEVEKTLALISNKLILKRSELKMDQKSFAKYVGVTQGLVSRWESGRYNFTVSTLIAICNKLDMSLDINLKNESKSSAKIIYIKQPVKKMHNWSNWELDRNNIVQGGAAS